MYFTPKKTIPPVAAAGLALAGCGDDSSELQQALDRMEGMDPAMALAQMLWEGFPLAGMNFRVMGLSEMVQQLQAKKDELCK